MLSTRRIFVQDLINIKLKEKLHSSPLKFGEMTIHPKLEGKKKHFPSIDI